MTNKEYLAVLPPEELYAMIHWLFFDYGRRWTDTRLAIIDWLQEERTVND